MELFALQQRIIHEFLVFLEQHPQLFPLVFIAGWLFVTTLLGVISGWYRLSSRFPNCTEVALGVVRSLSGRLGWVSMQNILRIEVCPSGLRFGMSRIFGLFSRDFFVPWQNMTIEQVRSFGMKAEKFQFRSSGFFIDGQLTMSPEQLWKITALAEHVAPSGLFPPPQPNSELRKRLVVQWLMGTVLAGLFFNLAPRFLVPQLHTSRALPNHGLPPWYVLVLFPAVAFGLAMIVQYLRFRRSDVSPR